MSVQYSEEITNAAANFSMMRRRRLILSKIATSLNTISTALNAFGVVYGMDRREGKSRFQNGNDEAVGVATLLMIGSRLLKGALRSVREKDVYCAGALARQLVEVEYLLFAFASSMRDAAEWLGSDAKDRKSRFQPRHIREDSSGYFSSSDYSHHCEVGGHPTPQIRHIIFHDDPVGLEVLLDDLTRHSRQILRFFKIWLVSYPLAEAQQFSGVANLLKKLDWQIANDQLALALSKIPKHERTP